MTPDSLRGRVLAAYSMMLMGMAPIGALISGVLADQIGAGDRGRGAVACGSGRACSHAIAGHPAGGARADPGQSATIPPEAS